MAPLVRAGASITVSSVWRIRIDVNMAWPIDADTLPDTVDRDARAVAKLELRSVVEELVDGQHEQAEQGDIDGHDHERPGGRASASGPPWRIRR